MSFEIQETFLIKVADTETLEYFSNKLYISVYQRVLDFLKEKNLFRFEDTQIYRGELGDIYNYPKARESFMYNHIPWDASYFFERIRFDIDYIFTAIEEEKLLRNLKVEGFVKMYGGGDHVLDEHSIDSIKEEKLHRCLDVDEFIKIYDSVDYVLKEYSIDSIDVRGIGSFLFMLMFRLSLRPTPYLENLTYKYFLKIES